MKYIVKHNIPHLPFKSEVVFPELSKQDAMFRFSQLEKFCVRAGYPVKSFLRETKNKPLRATLQVEVDGFVYYAELFAQ